MPNSDQTNDPSFRGHRPYKNSLTQKLLEAIEAGGEKTRSQWAAHFNTTTWKISYAMNRLRKNGHMIFPIGTYTNIYTDEHREGILTDITLIPANIRETMNRTKHQYLSPQLQTTFHIQEQAILKHPEMHEELEMQLTELLGKLLAAKENFKSYGHKKHSTRKN